MDTIYLLRMTPLAWQIIIAQRYIRDVSMKKNDVGPVFVMSGSTGGTASTLPPDVAGMGWECATKRSNMMLLSLNQREGMTNTRQLKVQREAQNKANTV